MISLRQHVTSLVAIFLALAIGLALGGGLLGDAGSDDADADSPTTATESATPTPVPTSDAEYAEAFVGEGAARLYAAGLDGHASAVLALPGSDPATVKALQTQVNAAAGAMTGTYTLSPSVLDAEGEDDVEQVGADLATQLADPRLDPAATTYERMGTLVALAMATTQASSVRADLAAVTVREALGTAGLLESPTDVRNAPLVLVVLPSGDEGTTADRAVLTAFVNGLAAQSAGVVVVGDTESADGGDLAHLRESDVVGPVSTVDGVETTIGQATCVLAMIAVAGGTTGSFGASGADGVVPLT